MKYFKLALFFVLTFSSVYSNPTLIEWDSSEGLARLQSSEAKENFWKITRFYESQVRLSYCGVSSSVIALNALSVEAPTTKFLGKYRTFVQEEFFNENVCAVVDRSNIEENGMSLVELYDALSTFPVSVTKIAAKDFTHEELRSIMISALKNPKQIILALYQRRELGQEGGGHWSPVAAYDEVSDSFLVMDVARFKYPPVWVDAALFMNSMQTTNIYGKSRGFIIVENMF